MNFLITSSGRRVGLVKAFINTFKKQKYNGKIFTTDLNPKLAPVSYFTHCFKVGNFLDKDYIEKLLEICIKNALLQN